MQIYNDATRDLSRLRAETLEYSTLGDVFDRAYTIVQQTMHSMNIIPENFIDRLQTIIDICVHIASSNRSVQLNTCITHGDFQPGNVLTDGENLWLIDWEYYDRRSVLYDYFTWTLKARHPNGLGKRLDALVSGNGSASMLDVWGFKQTGSISALVAVFLIEDLAVKLREIYSPAIFDKSYSLRPWISEVLPFLAYLQNKG